ncbi:MAG: Asp23/Gls24 family envelope stress response protein [Clostridia bacterium]|nr:Asp23/Gls24 family envelope stress response protein [Clostridia bacterium]
MANTSSALSINVDVLKKITKLAATEVNGVVGIPNKNIDLKGIVKSKNPFAGVKVENVNGALEISVYIIVSKDVNVKTIAEEVQANVKDKIQTMTGSAVTKVNVIVSDIKLKDDEIETDETEE